MIYLIVLICLFLCFVILLLLGKRKHDQIFGTRFEVSPLIDSYKEEDFNLKKKIFKIACKKDVISAFYYYNDNSNQDNIIIFSHGMYSDHTSYMQEIGFLVNNGFSVFTYDVLGYGQSGGKSTKGFGNNIKSLDYVVNFVEQNFKYKQIYLFGHSLGSFASLNVLKYHNNIDKVLVLAPFVSYYKELKNLTKTKCLAPFVYLVDLFKNKKYALCNTKHILKKYKKDLFVISSKDDSIINISNTLYLKKNFKNFQFLILNNKDHNPDYTENAVKKLKEFRTNLGVLKGAELIKYMKSLNYRELGELDNNIMDVIVNYFSS